MYWDDDLQRREYSRAKSLREAVEICGRSLEAWDREDYVPLVTEERVRSAIRVALESYKLALERTSMTYGKDYPWALDKDVLKQAANFEDVIRPIYLKLPRRLTFIMAERDFSTETQRRKGTAFRF